MSIRLMGPATLSLTLATCATCATRPPIEPPPARPAARPVGDGTVSDGTDL